MSDDVLSRGIDDCCETPAREGAADHFAVGQRPASDPLCPSLCPRSHQVGQRVAWSTVAALAREQPEPEQTAWICLDPDCQLVYFGRDGLQLFRTDLHRDPGFKHDSDGTICYCFGHRRGEIESEVENIGHSLIYEHIVGEVRAKRCRCEVTNPTGKCCLQDVRRAIAGRRRDA